jgi:DNA-binding response OmpR family regulator
MTKVLLIEDDPLIYRLYQKLFSLEGFEVELAENGQQGLKKLETYHPDIMLMDIMMPTMNGLEMLVKLKANPDTKDIPVIVLTNIADMNVTQLALSQGAVLCIIKSQTEPSEVVNSVKAVLSKSASASPDQPATPPLTETPE